MNHPYAPGGDRERARSGLRVRLMVCLALFVTTTTLVSPAIAELPALRPTSVAPLQVELDSSAQQWQQGEYTVSALAEYEVTARVLSSRSYSKGREAEVSPIDLALGWGEMAQREMLSQLQVTQDSRWYFVRWRGAVVEASDVIANSANTHTIPASEQIAKELAAVEQGDVVTLRGYLVSVRADDGWKWNSSLSRMDTGDGSCEVLWVESVEVEPDAPISYASVD